MREARATGLLVLGSDVIPDVDRDRRRRPIDGENDIEPVGQGVVLVRDVDLKLTDARWRSCVLRKGDTGRRRADGRRDDRERSAERERPRGGSENPMHDAGPELET